MSDPLRDQLETAKGHFARHDYPVAALALEAIVQQHQGFADAYHMLGVIYHDAGQLARADAALRRALAINPRYTEAALNLAVLLNDMGRYGEARETYQHAIAHCHDAAHGMDRFVAGKIANMHAEVAHAYRNAGRPDLAVAEYRRALALCPTFADLRTRLAALLMETDAHAAAEGELQRALADRPEYLPARVHLGICCYSLGRRQEAMAHWRRVLAVEPHNARAGMYLRMVQGLAPEPETDG